MILYHWYCLSDWWFALDAGKYFCSVSVKRKTRTLILWRILWHSGVLILELPNTAHRCSQRGPATVLLHGNDQAVLQKFTPFFNATFNCRSNKLSLFAMNYSVRIFWHSALVNCLKATEETCKLHDSVFEMGRKRLQMHVLCFTLYQLASSTLH